VPPFDSGSIRRNPLGIKGDGVFTEMRERSKPTGIGMTYPSRYAADGKVATHPQKAKSASLAHEPKH
ncbi:MAG: hypothetical protein AAFQ47_05095, partial [Pseudomonadota bacterium]